MAVKALFTTTIYKSIDIANTKLYYKLVNAGSQAPDKPTTLTPSGWSTTEPTFDISKDLYATMETIYSDDSFTYSDVTKYSSYEAAKQAYNTATNAQTTVNAYIDENEIIKGTQIASTNAFTGVAKFATLTDGQEITYWLPYAGTSSNATLNLTLSGGNTTGAIAIYYGGTSRLTTHYPAGSIIRMVYRQSVPISGSGSYTGWWCDANYDSNNYDRVRYNATIKADQTYFANGRLVAQGANGLYHNIVSYSTFDMDSPILYAGTTINALAKNSNTYTMYSSINFANNLTYQCFDIGDVTVAESNVGYSGNKITGNNTTGTVFSGSGIASAQVNDLYINTSTYYLYKCTLAGNASTAKWAYVKNLYKPAGKRWYTGTALSGTGTNKTGVAGTLGDYYFNTATGGYYECTTTGTSSTAKWQYDGLLIEPYKTLYLRGTISGSTFTVDKIPLTTAIPTAVDNLYYVSIGSVYPTFNSAQTAITAVNGFALFTEHPLYKFIDGEFKSLSKLANDNSVKIDGKIESYYQSTNPANSWSTNVEKEKHVGDIWYDTTTQKTFVYYKNNTNPVTYEWKWQNVPAELIDSVNGKATIYSGVVPANYSVGDYWLIPLNCYTNTYSLTSQTGEYSVNQTIKLDRYTLTVTGINSSTHAITSYTVNVPSNSNYSLAETISDGMLTLTISSNASFTLPTGCYGGSMCVATTAGTSYNASHWVKRNDYTPKDKTDTYATETNLNNNVLNLDGNINSNYSDLDGKINDNYLLLNGKIDGNYDDLSGTMSTNFSGLNGRTSSLEQYRTEFSGTYAKDKGDIVLREEALEDRLVTRIQATSGGNNLLRNSVGFRNTKYWTSPSSGIIEQTYSTLPQQMVTINFRWKKSGSNPAQIKLGYYSAGTFVEKYTVLNTSTATTEWASASFTYTSSNNNPVIRINDVFTSLQDSEASTNGLSGSRLVFSTNGLTITDLIISYGGGKNWSPYYNELYGSTFNLDADGFDIRESLSDKHSHLDANGLTFLGANNSIEGVFSKSETKTDNLYLTNAQYIGNLHIINIDNNNIIEY